MYGHPIDLVPDFKVLYWGPQTSLRFYLLSCTYAMLYCVIYDCARSTLYCLGSGVFSRYRQSPFGDLLSHTATDANPESVSKTGRLRCGCRLGGVAPRACFGSGNVMT